MSGAMRLDRKTKILIIDDEELICWCLKKTFERNEVWSVSCVYTGSDALRSIAENRYDVVITDLKLPDMKGSDFLQKVTRLTEDTPVIVMSAYLTDPEMIDITRFDIFRCVNKPFEINDVLSDVRDAMSYRFQE